MSIYFIKKKLAKPEQAIKKQEIMTAEGLICYWNLFNHKSLWLKTLHSSALHLKQQIFWSFIMASKNPNLRVENMNPCVKEMEYAVRGPLVIRATALQGEMEKVTLS